MQTTLATIPLMGLPGFWEIAIIVGLILLLFGASRLPKLGKGLGQGIRSFKTGLKGEQAEQQEKPAAPQPAPEPAADTGKKPDELASKSTDATGENKNQ